MSTITPSLYTVQRVWRQGTLVPIGRGPLYSAGRAPEPLESSAASKPRPAAAWTGAHRVDLRASVPLPGGRWYVTILAGPERRSADRLREEGQTHWLRRATVYVMLMSLALWLVVCALAAV